MATSATSPEMAEAIGETVAGYMREAHEEAERNGAAFRRMIEAERARQERQRAAAALEALRCRNLVDWGARRRSLERPVPGDQH